MLTRSDPRWRSMELFPRDKPQLVQFLWDKTQVGREEAHIGFYDPARNSLWPWFILNSLDPCRVLAPAFGDDDLSGLLLDAYSHDNPPAAWAPIIPTYENPTPAVW